MDRIVTDPATPTPGPEPRIYYDPPAYYNEDEIAAYRHGFDDGEAKEREAALAQPQADIEALAAIEHEQWIEWASTLLVHEPGISEERRQRWQRLIATPYADLTEAEKHQDRVYAEKVARVAQPQAGALAAALERLVAVCMTEEEDRAPADQDEWIAALKQADEALSGAQPQAGAGLDAWGMSILLRWREASFEGNASDLADLTDETTKYLEALDARSAAGEAPEPCASCNGRRWTDDENWSPDDPRTWKGEREHGNGLIPCGACNLGGWNVEDWAPEASDE